LSEEEGIQSEVINKEANVFMMAPFSFKELSGRIKTLVAAK
jgi:hypothetical protein